MNFNFLGLKKLVATCYMGSPIVGEQFEQLPIFDILPSEESTPKKFPYKIEINKKKRHSHWLHRLNTYQLLSLNSSAAFRVPFLQKVSQRWLIFCLVLF